MQSWIMRILLLQGNSMKSVFAALFSVLFFSTAAIADDASRIAVAAKLLSEVAQGSNTYKVSPSDAKAMLLEFALNEQMAESAEEFEGNWKGNSADAWEADSMNWGTDTASGALSYITNALENDLDAGEKSDADKVKYADGMMAAKRAFKILRSIKSVKFGVAPTGAVQCGVTFASLFILNTTTGKIYQIIMEGSGC